MTKTCIILIIIIRFLTITIKTWNKQTEDLYDFEAKDITTEELSIPQSIFQKIPHFLLSNEDKISINKDYQNLLDIKTARLILEMLYKTNTSFQIDSLKNSTNFPLIYRKQLERLWQVLPQNEKRPIEEGDIIKLGRVRLKIDKIVIKTSTDQNYMKTSTTNQINTMNHHTHHPSLNINPLINSANNIFCNNQNNNTSIYELTNEIKHKYTTEELKIKYDCRICYRSDSDFLNPLIIPCKCIGSMTYIHYKCLKQCIESKIQRKEEESFKIITWKNFYCDICLTDYPKYIKYKTTIYDLVDLEITYPQYIIFDYTQFDDVTKKTIRKGLIVTKITDDIDITIGRTQTNTLKMKDISVSRYHCIISKMNNKLQIMDKGSKFGTLLYLKKPYILMTKPKKDNLVDMYEGHNVNIISGKHYFTFNLIKKCSFFSCLFASTSCCSAKQINDDEFILNNNKQTKTKRKKLDNELATAMNSHVNDSYCDHYISLDTIIRNVEPDTISIHINNKYD